MLFLLNVCYLFSILVLVTSYAVFQRPNIVNNKHRLIYTITLNDVRHTDRHTDRQAGRQADKQKLLIQKKY